MTSSGGPIVFAHVCKMGLEGIASTRKDPPADRKDALWSAVKREAEEDWEVRTPRSVGEPCRENTSLLSAI
jgi:hypothetical protein